MAWEEDRKLGAVCVVEALRPLSLSSPSALGGADLFCKAISLSTGNVGARFCAERNQPDRRELQPEL